MGAAGGVCTVTHISVLTKDDILKLEENGSECFSVKYFPLEIAKGNNIVTFSVSCTEEETISEVCLFNSCNLNLLIIK